MKFEDYLKSNRESLDSLEPDQNDWEQIQKRLDQHASTEVNVGKINYLVWGSLLVFILILLLSLFIFRNYQEKQEHLIFAQQALDQELSEIKVLLTENKTSTRIKAINKVSLIDEKTNQIPSILLQTVQSDPSLNVKFAALNALESFIHLEDVRIGLIGLLVESNDQKLKIRILSFLSEVNEGRIEPYLEDIIENNENHSVLKKEAGVALERIKKL